MKKRMPSPAYVTAITSWNGGILHKLQWCRVRILDQDFSRRCCVCTRRRTLYGLLV